MCSRHVIRAGAQAKSNNRQAVGGSVVQSVWRRSCVYAVYVGGNCLRRLLMTCGRLCQRCAVLCLSMQISILGDDHSIMRQTHGTRTHTHKYTRHSRTLADKPALEYNNSLPTFRRPLKFIRVVFDFASFLQRGQRLQCALASLPLISPSWPCHAQWAWQVIWQHTFQFALCLPFCFVVSFVGLPDKPNQQSKKRRRGKGRATGCAAILKTSWETCQRVLCRQQVFQLCPPYLGSCVCVIFS